MHVLSALELLGVWERGLAHQPVERALILLTTACPEVPPEELAKLSIGQRDNLLLTLREWTFGSQVSSVAICPGCGDRLELSFNVADIRVAPASELTETFSLSVADYEVQFRLPNSLDLMAITSQMSASGDAPHNNAATTQQALLERCLLAASSHGEERPITELPSNVIDAVLERMAQADPQADVQLALSCPACRHQWQSVFDIVSFFWSEMNAWAYRILREVHILASAYGWREADILAMSPYRRQLYLKMVSK
jgi:uncharacterized protein (UPF0212 family)